ncbi:MAG: 2-dehydropantoate 2-reductase [Thermovirgaceae bacterium]|nr:2-dehydropantoate 2-reductase [Thermovirgaceae bacterium]
MITIYGCGALGSRVAVKFKEAGIDVQCVSRPGPHLDRIRSEGLLFGESNGELRTVRLDLFDDPSACPPADLVIILVKAWQTPGIAPRVKDLLSPGGFALTLQNGLGNVEALQGHIQGDRLLAGSISYGAFRPEPGVVRSGGDGFIRFGPVQPGVDARVVLDLFLSAGFRAGLEESPWSIIWEKVILNAAVNPVAALTRSPNGGLLDSPLTMKIMQVLCREATAAASAAGISVDPDTQWGQLKKILEMTAGNRPSMLQDIEAGNRTEIEAISGEILRQGEKASLSLPYTEVVYGLVKALEASSASGVS